MQGTERDCGMWDGELGTRNKILYYVMSTSWWLDTEDSVVRTQMHPAGYIQDKIPKPALHDPSHRAFEYLLNKRDCRSHTSTSQTSTAGEVEVTD